MKISYFGQKLKTEIFQKFDVKILCGFRANLGTSYRMEISKYARKSMESNFQQKISKICLNLKEIEGGG